MRHIGEAERGLRAAKRRGGKGGEVDRPAKERHLIRETQRGRLARPYSSLYGCALCPSSIVFRLAATPCSPALKVGRVKTEGEGDASGMPRFCTRARAERESTRSPPPPSGITPFHFQHHLHISSSSSQETPLPAGRGPV